MENAEADGASRENPGDLLTDNRRDLLSAREVPALVISWLGLCSRRFLTERIRSMQQVSIFVGIEGMEVDSAQFLVWEQGVRYGDDEKGLYVCNWHTHSVNDVDKMGWTRTREWDRTRSWYRGF